MSKTSQRWNGVLRSGEKLVWVMDKLLDELYPGVNFEDVEKKAVELIKETGGRAAFKDVPGYHHAVCLNVNEGVVHGVPRKYVIAEGDVVSLDVGLSYEGWVSDAAWTAVAGERSDGEKERFLAVGRGALRAGVARVVAGNRVGDITKAVEEQLNKGGVRAFSALTGHAVGRRLHELPNVPNVSGLFRDEEVVIKEGMTLAIEVIYTAGKDDLVRQSDGWTLVAADGKITASFEVTCGAGVNGPQVLTPIKPWREMEGGF